MSALCSRPFAEVMPYAPAVTDNRPCGCQMNPCGMNCASIYQPATSPAALLVDGRVPWLAIVPASGASKVCTAPPAERENPCITVPASLYCPVTTPNKLIEKGAAFAWRGAGLFELERSELAVSRAG